MELLENKISSEELTMGTPTYVVKVPELVEYLERSDQLILHGKERAPAAFIQAVSGIAMGTAYKAVDPASANEISWDSCWNIFRGLRSAGITMQENGTSRPIRLSDVIEVLDE